MKGSQKCELFLCVFVYIGIFINICRTNTASRKLQFYIASHSNKQFPKQIY